VLCDVFFDAPTTELIHVERGRFEQSIALGIIQQVGLVQGFLRQSGLPVLSATLL
jgi:hypothetical protein